MEYAGVAGKSVSEPESCRQRVDGNAQPSIILLPGSLGHWCIGVRRFSESSRMNKISAYTFCISMNNSFLISRGECSKCATCITSLHSSITALPHQLMLPSYIAKPRQFQTSLATTGLAHDTPSPMSSLAFRLCAYCLTTLPTSSTPATNGQFIQCLKAKA